MSENKERIADASRKLETVFAIMSEMEKHGQLNVSTDLVRALLQPTKEALKEETE